MPVAPTPFVLCADDYGLAPGIGIAIRALIEQGRLSATSCMTAGPCWPAEAKRLIPLADRADIGLHFTLTDQTPAGPMPRLAPDDRLPSVGRLIGLAYTGRLDIGEITAELTRQIDNFIGAFGRPPDFIDGHQHVHQLPGVYPAVLAALARWPGAWVRRCGEPLPGILRRSVAAPKAALLSAMGGALRRASIAAGIPGNDSFRGVYDLSGRVPFGDLMADFLAPASPRMLVMVHPGHADDTLRAVDPVVEQRETEYAWLAGEEFAALLQRRNLTPRRFVDTA